LNLWSGQAPCARTVGLHVATPGTPAGIRNTRKLRWGNYLYDERLFTLRAGKACRRSLNHNIMTRFQGDDL
jgi:hypothetical protein